MNFQIKQRLTNAKSVFYNLDFSNAKRFCSFSCFLFSFFLIFLLSLSFCAFCSFLASMCSFFASNYWKTDFIGFIFLILASAACYFSSQSRLNSSSFSKSICFTFINTRLQFFNQYQLSMDLPKEPTSHEIASTKSEFAFILELKKQIEQLLSSLVEGEEPSNDQIILLLKKQKQIDLSLEIQNSSEKLNEDNLIELVKQKVTLYEPTLQQIANKKQQILEGNNQQNWTDATQSVAASQDDIIYLDDDIVQAMEESQSDEQGNQQHQKQSSSQDEQQKIDFNELQKQFVVGQQSNHNFIYGKHDKFCVSASGTTDKKYLFSGGGDDILYFYNRAQAENGDIVKPFHQVKHSETVTKIDVSFDNEFVFSMTEKQINCTHIASKETTKLPVDDPVDFVCHKMGGVVAAAHGFNIDIYNIKGLKIYDSYCLDAQVTMFQFSNSGKQLIAACDNKLRIVTPKTSQILKVGGGSFHNGEITAIASAGNVIITGCIDGYLYSSSLNKGAVLCKSDQLGGTINNLCMAENYFICGPLESSIHWFDVNKMKRLFQSNLIGSSTDIIPVIDQNTFAVSDIKGNLYLYDRRNPLKEINILKAGNTVHKLWSNDNLLTAACEDGYLRAYDLKLMKN